jgi:hypothetical protein
MPGNYRSRLLQSVALFAVVLAGSARADDPKESAKRNWLKATAHVIPKETAPEG